MGYHVVDPSTLAPTPDHPCDRRSISDAVGLSTLSAAVYEIDPGEQLPRTYHSHEQREELFYVLAGTLAVRTPEGTREVETGQCFVVEPANPHLAFVPDDASEPARVLGVGAPQYDPARPYDPDATDAADAANAPDVTDATDAADGADTTDATDAADATDSGS